MVRRTKIVCTIGPAVDSPDKMRALIAAGMNVARLNFSHGDHVEKLAKINTLKQLRDELSVPLAIMLDTKGPEIRLGTIRDAPLALVAGQHWLLVPEPVDGDSERVSITPGYVLDCLFEGAVVYFDDGYITSHVVAVHPEGVEVQIHNGGLISTRKGVNIPNITLNLPAITEVDEIDLRFGCRNDIDIIAASFVRTPENILFVKQLLAEENKKDIVILAKIENNEGVQNFDDIIQVADGVMIARGDLGVEVPLSHVPKLQKMMIRKSYLAGKAVVTATQMLESMIHNPRPTRAEVSDVANAIYDGTSAVMLSGETAVGKYPVETVQTMINIIDQTEADLDYRAFFDQHSRFTYHDVPSSVTLATVKTAYSADAKAIFAFTSAGATARLLSRLRPPMPLIALTSTAKTYHQLALNWGIIPCLSDESKSMREAFDKLSKIALERKLVSYGDLVVVTAGAPFGISGTTNAMLVESIGDVLARGESGYGRSLHGNVALALSPSARQPYSVRGLLLLLLHCDPSYLPLLREASGFILDNHMHDSDSERYALYIAEELNKSCVVRADGATRHLKEGQLVTLDPAKAIVYKGVVTAQSVGGS